MGFIFAKVRYTVAVKQIRPTRISQSPLFNKVRHLFRKVPYLTRYNSTTAYINKAMAREPVLALKNIA